MAENKSTKRQSLSDVLILDTAKVAKVEDPFAITYELECTAFKAISITFDFSGSENKAIAGQDETNLKMVAEIRPFSRIRLGTIARVSDRARASVKLSMQWTTQMPSIEEMRIYTDAHNLKIKSVLSEARSIQFPAPVHDPTNEIVLQLCETHGKPFVDLDFPPTDKSLYNNSSGTLIHSRHRSGSSVVGAGTQREPVEWKRASEFMDGEVKVFCDGIDAADIRQGLLGNCWFLCSIAALTEFPKLVTDIIPKASRKVNQAGVYNVKFCKNGWWQVVRVDDFFPCIPGGGPKYSRANGNELWVLLLEKAYAKLCGSYDAIRAGWSYEAMMDMTGAPCRTFRLDHDEVQKQIETGELWQQLMLYDNMKYLMTASTRGEDTYIEPGMVRGKCADTGLVSGHAYTLISTVRTSTGVKLVKLRNPWGSGEWTGDWSDNSPLWTAEIQAEIGVINKADDGMFWMCFEDVLKHFYSINVCMVRHRKYNSEPWIEQRFKFTYQYDGGDSVPDTHRIQVPLYTLKVSTVGLFCASVHQEDIRCAGAKPYIDCGVSVMTLKEGSDHSYDLIAGTGSTAERQHQTEVVELQPGTYIVVPTTTGIKLREQMKVEAHTHTVNASSSTSTATAPAIVDWADSAVELTTLNDAGELEFSPIVVAAYTELFDCLDMNGSLYLNRGELNKFLERANGSHLSEAQYQNLLKMYEPTSGRKSLSLAGFLKFQFSLFQRSNYDEVNLRRTLQSLSLNIQAAYAKLMAEAQLHSQGGCSKCRQKAGGETAGGQKISAAAGVAPVPTQSRWAQARYIHCKREADETTAKGKETTSKVEKRSSRAAVLCVHGTGRFTLEMAPFDALAYEEAVELPIISNGKCTEYDDGKVQFHTLASGYYGVSFLVRNNHTTKPLSFTLDCSDSKNTITHRDGMKHQQIIPPNEAKVLHHLCPKEEGSWSWAHSGSYRFI